MMTQEQATEELFHAAFMGNVSVAVTALAAHASIVTARSDETHNTPLHGAAAHSGAIARLLIEKGADVNATNKNGQTPLHVGAAWGRADLVRLLIDRGAEFTSRDATGRTALEWAAHNGHKETQRIIFVAMQHQLSES
jgi:ankyrin repeat protein